MRRLKVVFITQEDPFYIAEFFRTFFAERHAHTDIAEFPMAYVLETLGQRSTGLAKRILGLYGAVGFMKLALKLVGAKLRSALFRIGVSRSPVTVADLLRSNGISVRQTANINGDDIWDELRAVAPDLLLSISATQKFGARLLSMAPLGCYNSHSGALPRFRGMMPTFWTLYENEPKATVTVHQMSPEIDAGGIWKQETTDIAPEDSLNDVILRTKRLSAAMTWELLELLHRGETPSLTSNDPGQKTYYRFPDARHSRDLRKRGRRLL